MLYRNNIFSIKKLLIAIQENFTKFNKKEIVNLTIYESLEDINHKELRIKYIELKKSIK